MESRIQDGLRLTVKTGFAFTKRGKQTDGENPKTLWERPFPGDTRWLREGTESLTPAEYP